jgi:flagellar hook-associated protein 2
MGTVGLSFGNPTGGTGFDVSTTVSEIVANFQAVEKPWQNQLATLSQEDAAFTSIGNDVSTLSNALNSLTAFEGALASKEGSSSNSDVLELDSATPEAIAGNHTITVQSLASTSSFSSSAITSTDTLSGNLTIQVGSGTTQTIAIQSGGESLSALAAQINTAGIGVSANVLTNSTGSFLSLVSSTSGSAGQLTIGGTVQDSTTALSFTQAQAGTDAVLTVDGNTVTSASNTVTSAIPGVTFQLLDVSPTTPISVEITNNTGDIESALGSFITAYNQVVQDLNTQEGDDSAGNPEPLFGNSSLALLQEQLGNAFNQVQTGVFDSSATPLAAGHADDSLTGSITITAGTTTATFPPTGSGSFTLSQLASQINGDSSLGITASIATDSDGGSFLKLVSATRGSAGDFTVTGGLTDATGISGNSGAGTSITFAQTSGGSAVDSFGLLGLSVTANGTISLDADTLNSVLNDDFQSVVNFFQDASGVGESFSNALTSLGNVSSTGVISEALDSDSQQESTLNADITNENQIISTQQAQITAELEQANNVLQAIPTQLSEINQLFEAITGQSSGANQN